MKVKHKQGYQSNTAPKSKMRDWLKENNLPAPKEVYYSQVKTKTWREQAKTLIEGAELNEGHKAVAISSLENGSRIPSVNRILGRENATPEDYLNYFRNLEARQGSI